MTVLLYILYCVMQAEIINLRWRLTNRKYLYLDPTSKPVAPPLEEGCTKYSSGKAYNIIKILISPTLELQTVARGAGILMDAQMLFISNGKGLPYYITL